MVIMACMYGGSDTYWKLDDGKSIIEFSLRSGNKLLTRLDKLFAIWWSLQKGGDNTGYGS